MMTDQPQWQAITFNGKVHAIFKLPAASQWRYVKENGERKAFATEHEAREAARDVALRILFPTIHSTAVPSEKKIAEALGVEDWLKSKREDRKNAVTHHKAGRRPFTEMKGRVA
jgi:hypothetical protein